MVILVEPSGRKVSFGVVDGLVRPTIGQSGNSSFLSVTTFGVVGVTSCRNLLW